MAWTQCRRQTGKGKPCPGGELKYEEEKSDARVPANNPPTFPLLKREVTRSAHEKMAQLTLTSQKHKHKILGKWEISVGFDGRAHRKPVAPKAPF